MPHPPQALKENTNRVENKIHLFRQVKNIFPLLEVAVVELGHVQDAPAVGVFHGIQLADVKGGQHCRVGQQSSQHPGIGDVGQGSQVQGSATVVVG